MIIRATTKEELREVLNYMCAQLRQTRVRVDLPRMGPPLHTEVRYGKRCGGDFPSHRTM